MSAKNNSYKLTSIRSTKDIHKLVIQISGEKRASSEDRFKQAKSDSGLTYSEISENISRKRMERGDTSNEDISPEKILRLPKRKKLTLEDKLFQEVAKEFNVSPKELYSEDDSEFFSRAIEKLNSSVSEDDEALHLTLLDDDEIEQQISAQVAQEDSLIKLHLQQLPRQQLQFFLENQDAYSHLEGADWCFFHNLSTLPNDIKNSILSLFPVISHSDLETASSLKANLLKYQKANAYTSHSDRPLDQSDLVNRVMAIYWDFSSTTGKLLRDLNILIKEPLRFDLFLLHPINWKCIMDSYCLRHTYPDIFQSLNELIQNLAERYSEGTKNLVFTYCE